MHIAYRTGKERSLMTTTVHVFEWHERYPFGNAATRLHDSQRYSGPAHG